ncbi:hypothetical protein GJ496_010836 [Pomphorhynchus laevis]|nr:hypothetical protein GJ496_010836 [Pomphorhynchus laevis]
MSLMQSLGTASVRTAKWCVPKMQKFWYYAKVEMRPPTFEEISKVPGEVRAMLKKNWRELTVKEAWLNTLITSECVFWFFLGEIIGRGSVIGYDVSRAKVHYPLGFLP